MQELDAQATVVDASGISGGITTTIARSDVQAALQETDLPPLVLDIRRGEESNNVAVAWKRDDLERLLGEATGDQIQLTFDRAAIEQAFDDVEAHGMREKAAVIAVAVAGAAAFAGGASAMPMGNEGGAAPAPIAAGPSGAHLGDTTAGAPAVDPAIATAIDEAAPAAAFQAGPSGAHLGDTTAQPTFQTGPSGAHLGDTTESPAIQTGPSGAHVGDVIERVAPNFQTGPSGAHLGDTTASPAPADAIERIAPNFQEPAIQTGPSGAHVGDVIAPSTAADYATGDGTTIGDVAPVVGAVGGAALLVIAGAAFASSHRRRIPAT